MNTWLKLTSLNNDELSSITGVEIENYYVKGMNQCNIKIHDDKLSPNCFVKNEISKFDIFRYIKTGISSLSTKDFMEQQSDNYDIVMENLYVKNSPFKVFYYKNNQIYVPNILYKKCSVQIRKGATHRGIYYESCDVKCVWFLP